MNKKRQNYGVLSEAQAWEIYQTVAPGLDNFLKQGSEAVKEFRAQDLLVAPEMWPILSGILLLKGQPGNAELDFSKVTEWFNGVVAEKCAGNKPPPKKLTAGEFRKTTLMAVRNYRTAAKRELASAQTGDGEAAAKLKIEEVKAILARQGWTAKPGTRKAKAKDVFQAETKVDTQAEGSVHSGAKNEMREGASGDAEGAGEAKPTRTPNDSKGVNSGTEGHTTQPSAETKFYAKGYGKPAEKGLKALGGQFDKEKKQWWFPTVEKCQEGQKLIDDAKAAPKKPGS
jgi:hypothetical protein